MKSSGKQIFDGKKKKKDSSIQEIIYENFSGFFLKLSSLKRRKEENTYGS